MCCDKTDNRINYLHERVLTTGYNVLTFKMLPEKDNPATLNVRNPGILQQSCIKQKKTLLLRQDVKSLKEQYPI